MGWFRSLFFLLLVAGFQTSCTHTLEQRGGGDGSASIEGAGVVAGAADHLEEHSRQVENEDAQEAAELAVKVPTEVASDDSNSVGLKETSEIGHIPEVYNHKVTKWINYFQGRGRENMRRYLSRSSRYLPKMKEILRKEGLPEDLVYIALIESGFSPKATSSANAVGYWQFIKGTGRRYGLRQNSYVDERRDFVHSTTAAAKYMKALYNLFGSWFLAISSYNVGENRIKRLVMKYYTRDFWQLARGGHLPRETQDYVPKFLAARLIAKHPEKYGFDDVVYEPPLDFKEIAFSKGINLRTFAKHMGLSLSEVKALNPAYLRNIIPFQKGGTVVRVPTRLDDDKVLAALNKSKSATKMKMVVAGSTRSYKIRRGDTLSHIAQRFGTSIRTLRRVNKLGRRSILYPGKRLKIPTGRFFGSDAAIASNVDGASGERKYRVRSGDNLFKIARKYRSSVASIRRRNGMGRGSLIKAGQTLVIPSRGEQVAGGGPAYHVVRRGDTLIGISRRYNIKLSRLTAINNLSRKKTLYIGKKLKVK